MPAAESAGNNQSEQELLEKIRDLKNRISVSPDSPVDVFGYENFLSILLNRLPDRIYFKNRHSEFVLINAAMARDIGLSDPAQAVGKTDHDFFSKVHADKAREDELRIMDTTIPMVNEDEQESTREGGAKWVNSTKLIWKGQNGEVLGTMGLTRDISHLKATQEKLNQVNQSLEEKVSARTEELKKVNDGLGLRIQQLDYLNRKARTIAKQLDRERLFAEIYNSFRERYPHAVIILFEHVDGKLKLRDYTGTVLNLKDVARCRMNLEASKGEYFGTPDCLPDWKEEGQNFGKVLEGYPCYVCLPLVFEKSLKGVVQFFHREEFSEHFDLEYSILATLGAQASIAIENCNLYERVQTQMRMESELEIARNIQMRFIPENFEIPRYRMAGVSRPALQVGGDYLDYFQNKRGDWVIMIADVCGKGIPASIYMTSLRSTFRVVAAEESSSRDILIRINDYMGAELQKDHSFITAMCIVISNKSDGSSSGLINFSRAGHPWLLCKKKDSSQSEKLKSEGMALGMAMGDFYNNNIEEQILEVRPGDQIMAYTDGLDEAVNDQGESFGVARIQEFLDSSGGAHPESLREKLLERIAHFTEGREQYDDLTFFLIEKK